MSRKKSTETVSLNIRVSQEINTILQTESQNRGISKNELTKMILYKSKEVLNLFYPALSLDTIKQNLLREQMTEYNILEKRKNGERRVESIEVQKDRRIGIRRAADIKKVFSNKGE